MDKYFELTNKLRILLKNESIIPVTHEEKADGIKPLQLRDTLLLLGDVLEEDLDKNIYVASIKSGLWNLGRAYVAVCTTDNSILIASYANEGIINQHMADNAINNIVNRIKSKKNIFESRVKWYTKIGQGVHEK